MKKVITITLLMASLACGSDGDDDCWYETSGSTTYEVCCGEYADDGTCEWTYVEGVVGRDNKPYCYDENGRKVCYENPK